MPLPRFVIIGAAKAATSWIAHQLRARPDIFMPGPEPHFFSRAYGNGAGWYARLFDDARPGQIVGEKSADYLADAHVPARLAALLPQARLIAQLRNPVDRAYSDYCMLFRRGQVNGDVDQQLDWRRTDAPRFLADGLYARHLACFHDHFPREQLTILLHDDIVARPDAMLAQICATLGLPPVDRHQPLGARVNDSRAALVPLALRRLPGPVKRMATPLRGRPAFERLRRMIARPVCYPPLPDGTRRRLQDFYRDDVAALGTLIGRDLAGWLAPREA